MGFLLDLGLVLDGEVTQNPQDTAARGNGMSRTSERHGSLYPDRYPL